jgi:GT2 family glycosyltransferase
MVPVEVPERADAGRWFLLRGLVARPGLSRLVARAATPSGAPEVDLGWWQQGDRLSVVLPVADGAAALELLDADSGEPVATRCLLAPLGSARAAWLMLGHAGAGKALVDALAHGPRVALQRMALRYRARLGRTGPRRFACDVRLSARHLLAGVAWRPIHELAGDGDLLRATGDDPQLLLDLGGAPLALPAGWYSMEAAFDVRNGRMIAPALYPDYGNGCDPAEMIRLPEPAGDGRLRTLVMFKAPVRALRFDPSVRRLSFGWREFALGRVGRREALMRLFEMRASADGSRGWRARGVVIARFALDVLRHGLSTATARLHQGRGDQEHGDYDAWVRRYDSLSVRDIAGFRERAAAISDGPLVSILLPVYDTPERYLRRCIASVRAQAYRNWELCIVDDASPSAVPSRTIRAAARRDPRIRFMRRDSNGHISAASNDALAMARGEYVALLDHDDELRPHALLEMVEAARRNPDAALFYSDEDKIDEKGRRCQPNFKPDWNHDLLRGQNYVCHLAMLRTSLAREVGGFRVGYEGSQDHDLFLRCSERLGPGQVVHVPKVLYHWRAIVGSTALERGAKDYAAEAGMRAVADHLARIAPGAGVESLEHGHYRVRWPLPDPPRVDIVIPTRDRLDLVRCCVESLLANTRYRDYRVLLVDNQSREQATLDWLDAISGEPRVRVLRYDAPFNYSAINNWAVAQGDGGVVCLLNNDIEVIDGDWLRELASQAMRPGVGAVGAMLYYPDRTIQHAGVVLGMGGVANHVYSGAPEGHPGHGARALVAQELSAVTGACLAVRRDRYTEVGGLDERLQVAFNDVDFCLRLLEAGYRNVWTPFARLLHHESATRGRDEAGPGRDRFVGEARYMEERWGDYLRGDPAWNPSLSLDRLDGALAFPPRAAGSTRRIGAR